MENSEHAAISCTNGTGGIEPGCGYLSLSGTVSVVSRCSGGWHPRLAYISPLGRGRLLLDQTYKKIWLYSGICGSALYIRKNWRLTLQ